jgi:hypothetical protein
MAARLFIQKVSIIHVLVGNGILCNLHLLIFDELIMMSHSMLNIRIVPVMILKLFVAHSDHWTRRSILVSLITLVSNEYYIRLVRATVRSLFVALLPVTTQRGSTICSRILIHSTNGISTDVLGRLLGEIE